MPDYGEMRTAIRAFNEHVRTRGRPATERPPSGVPPEVETAAAVGQCDRLVVADQPGPPRSTR